MNTPKLNLAVIVMNEKKVLLKKIRDNGKEFWDFPTGLLGFREDFGVSALRIVQDETGIVVKVLDDSPVYIINEIPRGLSEHYVTLFILSYLGHNEFKVMRLEKEGRYRMYLWGCLPNNTSTRIKKLVSQGYNPCRDLK